MTKIKETQLELFNTDAMSIEQVLGELTLDLREDSCNWPSLLAELIDVVADYFEGLSLFDSNRTMNMAQDVILRISHYLGGRAVYLPKDEKLRKAIRDRFIYRAFDGTNHLVLAKKSGLTSAMVYNIIAKQRKLKDNRLQMELPFKD